jgi:hypothetical protein
MIFSAADRVSLKISLGCSNGAVGSLFMVRLLNEINIDTLKSIYVIEKLLG